MPAARLLAIDLDGTLFRRDGTIGDADRAAITRARAAGIAVTLASGRMAAATFPAARLLDLDQPVVCADGALVACARTGDVRFQRSLPAAAVGAALGAFAEHGLLPFVLNGDCVRSVEQAARFRPFVEGYASRLEICEADALCAEDALLALGLGTEDVIVQALAASELAAGDHADCAAFPLGGSGVWAIRIQARGVSKALGVAHLAAHLGITAEEVAAVGDWHNDVPLFAWAGRSFAMAQAPAAVREAATDVLSATSTDGGGVAEAIALLLDRS